MPSPRASLLFLGDYYGTLAAARCLGQHGIDVRLADESRLTRTGASRHVREFHRTPPVSDARAFLEYLLTEGKTPGLAGSVLHPASDELVFLFAQAREKLAAHYTLFMPDLAGIYRILNKERLHEACTKVGCPTPRTWCPKGEAELEAILREVDVKVLLKPKTQVQLRSGQKGAEIPDGSDLATSFRAFVTDNPYGDELVAHDPDVVWPMVQEFMPGAAQGIYSVAGFATEEGRVVARASRKILQRPRRLGIGLCFEAAPLEPELVATIGALCKELGYAGIFEIEFVEHEGKPRLIDFNPRAYSQMAFEIDRQLPLPLLHYLSAIGELGERDRLLDRAERWQATDPGNQVYTHSLLLELVQAGQLASRVARGQEREDWFGWMRTHRDRLTDAVRAPGDFGPVVADAAQHARQFLKHPRSFLRSLSR